MVRLPRSSREVRKCQFESLVVAPKMSVSSCQRYTSNRESLNRAWSLRTYPQHVGVEQRMKVELFQPESVTEPRHWVRHDQAFAMMLRPGSIEWGSKRSALEKFDYAAGDLALCDRHVGEWVGLMNVQRLQLGISYAALMATSDGPYGDVELHPSRHVAGLRLKSLLPDDPLGL